MEGGSPVESPPLNPPVPLLLTSLPDLPPHECRDGIVLRPIMYLEELRLSADLHKRLKDEERR